MGQFNQKSQLINNIGSPDSFDEEEQELFLEQVVQGDPELFFIDVCLREILCKVENEQLA